MKEQMIQEPLVGLAEIMQLPAETNRFVVAEGWVEIEHDQMPVAVELGKRAAALAVIDDFMATGRRIRGSEWALRDQNSRFCRRYGGEAFRVHQNAKRRYDQRVHDFRTAVDVLAATDALRANGQDEEKVWMEHMRMQIEVNRANLR
jgi:hypothetical protein